MSNSVAVVFVILVGTLQYVLGYTAKANYPIPFFVGWFEGNLYSSLRTELEFYVSQLASV
jgi:hypothetical protein